MRRSRWFVVVAVGSLVAALVSGLSAASAVPSSTSVLVVGRLTLHRCDVLPHAWCGSIQRQWDPSGHVSGSLAVGFAYVPASDTSQPALGTLVPHEGGPGYSTTDSAVDYAAMSGPLLQHRNLLLVDQRGTGRTVPIRCPSLQNLVGPYAPAAAICAAKLGDHFDLYGSTLSADDLSAVISALQLPPVDLYGDSYGTFFSQVFLGRHPDQLRSVILDSAYPTYGEDAWYGTQGPALIGSYQKVCQRTPSCQALGGSTIGRLTRLLDQLRRKPLHARQSGADGRMHNVTIDPVELTYVAYAATFSTAIYREFDPAVRAALAGDVAPIGRLVAEQDFVGGDGPAVDYSEGADAAVACQDYPELYDMTQPPAVREQQYAAAVQAKQQSDPGIYEPFTLQEYLSSGWGQQDICQQWPVADPAHAAAVPMPLGGHYAAVPTLILSGELDTITTPAEGALVAAQIPGSRQVLVANSTHVTAEDDSDGCGRALVQAFVVAPTAALPAPDLKCARDVPPVRGAPTYSTSFRGNGSGDLRTRAAVTAALTVADMTDRWQESIASTGFGLHGGTWSYTGDHTVTLHLKGVRLAEDLAVTGTVVWHRYAHQLTATLHVAQVDAKGAAVRTDHVNGTLTGSWDTRAAGAHVQLTGTLGGQPVSYRFLAP